MHRIDKISKRYMWKFNWDWAKLIVDWTSALDEILSCIRDSKKNVKIRIYMWRNDDSWRKILNALKEKLTENKDFEVHIEKDAFWSRVYDFQRYISFWRLWWDMFSSKEWIAFIKMKNVFFRYTWTPSILLFKYNKENNHSKVYIFDWWTQNCTAIIWWMNISDDYMRPRNQQEPEKWGWHDYMVKISWNAARKIYVQWFEKNNQYIKRKFKEWVNVVMSMKSMQTAEIMKELNKAKKSIIIEHWYITHNKIIRKLKRLSRKWVSVRIIMPDESDWVYHANMQSIHKFLKEPILPHSKKEDLKVFLFKWMIHAKVILIDEYTSIIWSANLTSWSFWLLRETNAIFKQKDWISKELLAQLKEDMRTSTLVTKDNLPKYNKWLAMIQRLFI